MLKFTVLAVLVVIAATALAQDDSQYRSEETAFGGVRVARSPSPSRQGISGGHRYHGVQHHGGHPGNNQYGQHGNAGINRYPNQGLGGSYGSYPGGHNQYQPQYGNNNGFNNGYNGNRRG